MIPIPIRDEDAEAEARHEAEVDSEVIACRYCGGGVDFGEKFQVIPEDIGGGLLREVYVHQLCLEKKGKR